MQEQRQQFGRTRLAKDFKSSDELLAEIRNMLAPTQKENTRKNLTPEEIDNLLKQSLHYYNKNTNNETPNKPHLTDKVEEALQIVKKHHDQPFIKEYTKQKIYSEMFSNLRKELPENQMLYYQRQREGLMRQRQIEEEDERKREEQVIASRKKFVRYESNSLPYLQIKQFRSRQGDSSLPFLINQASQKQQGSKNNLIKERSNELQQAYEQKKKNHMVSQSTSRILRAEDKDTILNKNHSRTIIEGDKDIVIEVVDNDDTMNQQWVINQRKANVQKMLVQNPKFLRIIRQILIKSIELEQYLNEEQAPYKNRSSIIKSDTAFKYTQTPIVYTNQYHEKKYEKARELTRNYRSKGVVLKEMNGRSISKAQRLLFQKPLLISKMIGEKTQFHIKKIQLRQDQILWCSQNDEITQNCKKIEIVVQEIGIVKAKKQQGGFFSKKVSQVDVVVVKGKNRTLRFQKTNSDGQKLYKELCRVMAQKFLELNIIISCKFNEDLNDFVKDQNTTKFSLADNFLQEHEKYPEKDYKLMTINVFTALFPYRRQITALNLKNVKLNEVEIDSFVKSLTPLQKIQEIYISKAKFNEKTINELFTFISKLNYQNLKVSLEECAIDDNMLIQAQANIEKCTNIEYLSVAKNNFTRRGFSPFLFLAGQSRCRIKQFKANGNKIASLFPLGQFIKRAQRIDSVYAEDCGFSFDNREELAHFFNCCKNSTIKKLSLMGNDPVNSFHPFEEYWVSNNPKEILIEVGTFSEKTSKNLQGKLLDC